MAVTAALADATYRSGTTSIASVPIGTAAAGRVVVALCAALDSNFNRLYNETIGGVAIATQDGTADACILATGTTATIASSGASQLEVTGVYALSGGAAVRPTRVALRSISADGSISISVEVGAGSTVIAQTINFTGSTSGTFGGTAGVSSDGTFNNGSGEFYRVGHADQATGGTVTVTASVATGLSVWVYDSVGPEWSLIGVSAPVLASSGNLTLAEPSGTAQNDVVIAAISYRSTAAFTNPASWSALATQQSSGNTTNGSGGIPSGLLAGIVRGVGAPSYAFTRTAGSVAQGRAYTYRSSTAGAPSLGTGSAATAGSAALTVTTAGFTPSASNALLFSLTVSGDSSNNFPLDMGAATSPVAWAQPDYYSDATAPGAVGMVSSAIQTTAGATGTFTGNNGSSARSALLVGQILPPTGGGGNLTLAVAGGSYALTGTAATLKHSRAVGAGAGSYALTGTNATLRKAKNLAAGAGSYALTGTAATPNVARKVAAGAGSYALTGTAATPKHGYAVTVGAGSYSLSGTAATLKFTRLLVPAAGSYTLTGTAATLKFTRLLTPAAGSYALTGTDAALTKLSARTLAAASGSYAVTGSDVSLVSMRVLAADAGSYVLTGTAAALSYQPGVVVETASGGDDAPSLRRLKKYQQNEEKFQRQKREREEALNATMEGRTKKPPSLKNTAELGGPKVIEIDDDDDDYDIMMWAAA